MSKYFKLSIDVFYSQFFIYLIMSAQIFAVLFFSVDSINYIGNKLYTLYFTQPLTQTNFICYMPIPEVFYSQDTEYVSKQFENRFSCYDDLIGLESISKSCAFAVSGKGNNYEVRAISGNIINNLNIKIKRGNNLKQPVQKEGVINCLTSDNELELGDKFDIELCLPQNNNKQILTVEIVGVVEKPYFNIDVTSSGMEQGFSDSFKFNSREELEVSKFELLWINYDDICTFIEENNLDNNRESQVYKEFLFFQESLTLKQMAENESILKRTGYTFNSENAHDKGEIIDFLKKEIPPLIAITLIAIIGFSLMNVLGIIHSKKRFEVLYMCGATKKQAIRISIILASSVIVFSNILVVCLIATSYFTNVFEWDSSFINYNVAFLIILDLVLWVIAILTSIATVNKLKIWKRE